ncbi:MAG: adenine deaminase C-terminal domain-containing protein, partial [Nitrospinota bacterium]
VAPGLRADLVVLESLEKLTVKDVYREGELVAQGGELLHPEDLLHGPRLRSSINLRWESLKSLEVPAEGSLLKVMELVPDQLITRQRLEEPSVLDGLAQADTSRDLLKIAVLERHINSGRVGVGFIRGFGLKAGALGSSVAHDSHNIILLGTSDADMAAAAHAVVRMHGGQVVVKEGEVVEALPLPIAGLMGKGSAEEVASLIRRLSEGARSLGCPLPNPFMTLSFMALPVVPELKVTDMGLVNVEEGRVVPLFGEG